jgi:multimeric flavodoxin WrbA
MTRYVLIMKGSPRRHGNSALLADELARGVGDAGATAESAYVHGMEIHACRACNRCRETGGACVISDGMQPLYPKIARADALVVVSPIYWYALTAQTKLWIDRCYALVNNPEGDRTVGKDFGAILTYAQPDIESSGAINAIGMLYDLFDRGTLVGIVHGSVHAAGDVRARPDLLAQAYDLGCRLGSGEFYRRDPHVPERDLVVSQYTSFQK